MFGLRICASTFFLSVFSLFFFFFFFQAAVVDQDFHEQCFCVLFMDPQITLFSNFFIKNESHSTIYTFKNYFVIVFSVSVFSFSKNKLNPNGPKVNKEFYFMEFFSCVLNMSYNEKVFAINLYYVTSIKIHAIVW